MFKHARPPECCFLAILEHGPEKWIPVFGKITLKTILVWMAAEVE